jgi:putative hemolysin
MQLLIPTIPSWALQAIAGIAVTAPIVLFFGEITPKAVGAKANQMVAPLNIGPLHFIYDLFKPIRALLNIILNFVTRKIANIHAGPQLEPGKDPILREEEFLFMVEEGHREGAIQQTELELIKNVFELDDRTVTDILTPIAKVFALPANTPIKAAMTTLGRNRFSRVPVFGANRRQIVGMLYTKDLLFAGIETQNETIAALTREPFIVQATMQLNALFRRMKQSRTHMALVEKAPNEIIGVVTMNDLLEALFEDVIDEDRPGAKA